MSPSPPSSAVLAAGVEGLETLKWTALAASRACLARANVSAASAAELVGEAFGELRVHAARPPVASASVSAVASSARDVIGRLTRPACQTRVTLQVRPGTGWRGTQTRRDMTDATDSPVSWVAEHTRRYVESGGEDGHEGRPGGGGARAPPPLCGERRRGRPRVATRGTDAASDHDRAQVRGQAAHRAHLRP